ncbi:hypothetical protein Hanom_Chr04g00329831 [Helianthus anomalus]
MRGMTKHLSLYKIDWTRFKLKINRYVTFFTPYNVTYQTRTQLKRLVWWVRELIWYINPTSDAYRTNVGQVPYLAMVSLHNIKFVKKYTIIA